MDAQGFLCSERAPKKQGKDLDYGPEYRRSLPLNSISLTASLESRPTWVTTAKLNSGHLRFDPHAEDGVIKNVRYFGAHFDAHTLMKANNEEDGDNKFPVGEDFYPALHRMLKCKKDWGEDFCFRGRAVFEHGILEWTETTLTEFEETLDAAGIFGAVAVSRYPYEYCSNVWRAFCELWGPLTNTFHHADGEMSISLHDLNVIGGLPVSGEPYEEFIPPNKDLVKVELYHSMVAELLRIYTYLCAAYKSRYVYWPWWIEHFYRGEIIYGAYGECKNSGVPKLREPKLELKISKQGRLAAFLAFWLSRFVLPSNSKKIRPETFYMASLMAQGIRVSLAPTVLGYVYHGLGEMATHSAGPGSSNSCLPIHYVIGWLGEYFPYLYSSRSDKEFPGGYPRLARYAGVQGRSLSITEARMVFRTNKSVVHRPISVACEKDRFLLDDDKLPDVLFEVLICMRSAVLPVRVGESLFLEPYYPNRFARQFGLDQSVPSNKLSFSVSKRQQCGVEDLLRAQTILYRKNTTSRFFIPRSSRSGQCTWWYCRWWSRACTPYLGLSVSKTFMTLNKRPLEKPQRVFVVQNLREISTGLKQEVKISEVEKSLGKSSRKAPRKSRDGASCSKASRARPTNECGGHKRVRLEKVVKETVVIPVKSSSNGERELDVHSPLRVEALNPVIENEAVMPTICLSEASSNQALSPLSNLENSISNLLGSELPSFKKNYLIAQVVDIYAKVSSSSMPKELLVHVLDIRSSLDMLRPAIKPLKAGKLQLEAFVTAIEKMLEVADQSLNTTEVLEQRTTMDVELEECKKSKGSLESQLVGSSKELEALKATESDIIADEQRVQKRRSEYNAKRQSLEDTLQELKGSLKEHDERGQKLQEDRAAYMAEKLPEIEQASASYKLETEAYQSLFDSLFPLFHVCTTSVQT